MGIGRALLLLGVAVSVTNVSSKGSKLPCVIPGGKEYRNARYSLVYHSDRLAYTNIGEIFDGNWNFLPGAEVHHGMKMRVACKKDIYGDAVHKLYQTKCVNSKWSNELPNCTVDRSCKSPMLNISGASPIVPFNPRYTFHNDFEMIYTCDEGFIIKGRYWIACKDGVWSTPEFECVPNVCQEPVMPGTILASDWKIESGVYPNRYIVTFTCGPGWYLAGRGVLVCENQQWTGQTDACQIYKAVGLDVVNVTVSSVNDSAILVEWDVATNEPDVDIQYFRIMFTTEPGQPPETWDSSLVINNNNNITNFRATLEELVPNKVYTVGVVAGDGTGEGPMSNLAWVFARGTGAHSDYSDEAYLDYNLDRDTYYDYSYEETQTETVPETPINISASVHDNGIMVTWDEPESSVRVVAYVVEYTTDGFQWEPTDLLFVPRSSWQLRDAEYGIEYRFRVISHGYNSHSVPSEEVQISMPTGPEGCEPPTIPNAIAPDHGEESSRITHGSTLTYICEDNKVMVGNSTMVCNSGTWDMSYFICRVLASLIKSGVGPYLFGSSEIIIIQGKNRTVVECLECIDLRNEDVTYTVIREVDISQINPNHYHYITPTSYIQECEAMDDDKPSIDADHAHTITYKILFLLKGLLAERKFMMRRLAVHIHPRSCKTDTNNAVTFGYTKEVTSRTIEIHMYLKHHKSDSHYAATLIHEISHALTHHIDEHHDETWFQVTSKIMALIVPYKVDMNIQDCPQYQFHPLALGANYCKRC